MIGASSNLLSIHGVMLAKHEACGVLLDTLQVAR
jgi:hypothetical protein